MTEFRERTNNQCCLLQLSFLALVNPASIRILSLPVLLLADLLPLEIRSPGSPQMRVLIGLCAVVVALSACAKLTPKPPPAPMPLASAAEYAQLATEGSTAVTGQVFMRTRGGDVKLGAGNQVILDPATTYAGEWIKRGLLHVESLGDRGSDPRFQRVQRRSVADAQGRFRFENVPPGTYWIRSYVQWFVSNRMPIQGGVLVDLVYVKPNQSIVDVILTR